MPSPGLPLSPSPSSGVNIKQVGTTTAPVGELDGHTAAKVNAWIKKIKLTMNKETAKSLDLTIEQVQHAHSVLSKSARPDLGQLACRWGLPSSLLQKGIADKQLLTFCAVCAFLSSHSDK